MDDALDASPLTQGRAAKAAGISGTRWRQIVNGRERKGGVDVLVNGPADTLARMARVLKVTPDQLRAAKRADAAELLERQTSFASAAVDDSNLVAAWERAAADLQAAQYRAIAAADAASNANREARTALDVYYLATEQVQGLAAQMAERQRQGDEPWPSLMAAMEHNPGDTPAGQSEESDT